MSVIMVDDVCVLCSTMLERLDRRSITLLDVVALCDREATSLHSQEIANRAAVYGVQPSTCHVLQLCFTAARNRV